MNSKIRYIEVILPLPVEGTFTYSLHNDSDDVRVGQRVIVQFGIRKLYTAIVSSVTLEKPSGYNVKDVIAILDESPIITGIQIQHWQWLSSYYMCKLGEVMSLALPTSLKLASESIIIIHPNFDGDLTNLNENEIILVNQLINKQTLLIKDVILLLNQRTVFPIINELIRKDIINIKEQINDSFKFKTIDILELNTKDIKSSLSKVIGAKKQYELLDKFFKYVNKYPDKKWSVFEVLRKTGISRSILNSLVKKGLLKITKKEVSRLIKSTTSIFPLKKLSNQQENAYNEIKKCFNRQQVCLLHGVTSSGKTEIYIKLINDTIDQGKQVLYLLPEIALTTQIIHRIKDHFGDLVGVSHSNLSNSERVEVWNSVKENDKSRLQHTVIIGTRSSLFLPFYNLGLIIVDEEHDSSFKEQMKSPKYNARDAAIFLSKLHQARILLGSATPSIESYYNAKNNKYGFVELTSRYGNISMPNINVVDIRKAYFKKEMQYHFTPYLINQIKQSLEEGSQIILFQNRRGYAPILECESCNWSPNCKNCDISLTYHKSVNILRCHYCGYTENRSLECKTCGHNNIIDKGFGTEQIEEELNILFPEAKVQRMDHDTTRKRNSYSKIITSFENGMIDILVGTQMVTKGLDFDNVSLVGILNADNILKFPHFRSYERGFQIMSQVSGRSGRKNKVGKVVLQTYDINHEVINQIKNHDYQLMYKTQVQERHIFKYPPFVRLISLNFQHKDKEKLTLLSKTIAVTLRKSFDNRILGPEDPQVSKIRNYYNKNILIKIEVGSSLVEAKMILSKIINKYRIQSNFKSLRINIDVDPI